MKKSRVISFDFIRTIAVIGVIVGHSLALAARASQEMEVIEKYGTVLLRPVVPAFLFLSGIFYRPNQSGREAGIRLARIITPYLFFAAVFTVIYGIQRIRYAPLNYLLRIFTGEIHPIYYYVFLMMEFTVALFVLEKIFGYERMLVPLFITAMVLSILHGSFSKEIMERTGIKDSMVLFYTYRSPLLWGIYYMAGMAFGHYPNLLKKTIKYKRWIRCMFAGIVAFYILMAYFELGDLDGLNSVITILICFFAILCLLTIPVKSERWTYFSKRSYTIYLAHVPFYYFMERIWNTQFSLPAIFMIVINLGIMGGGALLICALGKMILKEHSYYIIGS